MLRFKNALINLKTHLLFLTPAVLTAALFALPAQAMTNLKQVQVSNGAVIDLLFDGKIDRSQIKTEYINDVIQISLSDVGVYPAKISSVNGGNLVKIFAYQYAPKLVRCRLTVKGKAEDYKDRLQLQFQGKMINIRISDTAIKQDSILTQSSHAEEKTSEKKTDIPTIPVESSQAIKSDEALLAHVTAPTTSKPLPIREAPSRSERKTERLALSGAKPLPSMMSVVTKLMAVIAFFGVIALAVKKFTLRNTNVGATRRSLNARVRKGENGWLDVLGGIARNATATIGRKDKMIEVLSNHHLGPKKSIAVVRVMGRTMVLGVTNESINLISQIAGDAAGLDSAEDLAGEGFDDSSIDADLERILGVKSTVPAPKKAAPEIPTQPNTSGFSALLNSETQKPAGGGKVRSQIRSRLEGLKSL